MSDSLGNNRRRFSRFPIEGSVKLAGRELLTLPEREMRQIRGDEIAMIFQEPMSSLSPVHTVGDQIVEVLQLHWRMGKKAARERTVDLLRQVLDPDRLYLKG